MKTLPTFSHHVVKSASKTDLWRLNRQDDVSVAAYQDPGVVCALGEVPASSVLFRNKTNASFRL